ncbi:hypothetical protein NS234_07445 [Microbacterium oxydans]|uniref:hypothetical protein n=1 Tax=Microbacterium oxydans TaxID=82380 RepID=UPI000733F385|nr:hypothetical protein [Microbacterium oxydans]KTR77431.1 hypothetical protein NS234_07445 [Microbacterium oxydans]
MPIKIDFLSNVRDFIRGTDDAEKALDDVADSLDDVARDGDRSMERLERSFRDVAAQAKDTARETKDISKATRDVGDEGARDLRKVGDAAEEVSGEFKQNLGETFSSFRGDLADLPQIAQDTLGGLAGSGALGGLPGLFLTAAGAAGLGALIGGLDQLNEASEASEAKANDLATAYIDAGTTVLDTLTLASRVQSVLTTTETREEAEKLVDTLGIDLSTAARIVAGDTNALAGAQQVLSDQYAALNQKKRETTDASFAQADAILEEQRKLEGMSDALNVYNDRNNLAADRATKVSDAIRSMIADATTATKEVDALGNELYTLDDGAQFVIEADTGLATAAIDRFQGDVDGIPETITVTPKANTDDAVARVNGFKGDISSLPSSVQIGMYVNAELSEAQRRMDGFITRNNGRTIQFKTRVISPDGWDR